MGNTSDETNKKKQEDSGICQSYKEWQMYKYAIPLFEKRVKENIEDFKVQADCLFEIGYCLIEIGKIREGISKIDIAINIAKTHNILNIGRYYDKKAEGLRYLGENDESIKYCKEALNCYINYPESKSDEFFGSNLLNKANCYSNFGRANRNKGD